MIFKYRKYKYSEDKLSKLDKLSQEYEELFLRILEKDNLSYDDGQKFLIGFDKIKKYLTGSIILNIKKDFDSKTPIEKKLSTLYNQYMYMYPDFQDFNFRVQEEFMDICEGTIYSSIGLGSKKFKKLDEDSNLILYINKMFFYDVLNFLDAKVNNLKKAKEVVTELTKDLDKHENEMIKEVEVDKLLLEKNIKDSVGEDIFQQIRETLLNEEDIPPHLEELIKYIKS